MRRIAAGTPSATSLTPLRVAGFPTLAAAYSINELGNWLGDIALAVLVYDHTKSALATAALFVATRFVPALAAPPIVSRVERLPPRPALASLYALDAVVFAVLALLAVGSFSLPLILVLAACDGSLALAARALTRSTAAALLSPHGLLRRGNSIFNFGFTAAGAFGPAIAGVVTSQAGVSTALALDAGSFAFVAMLIVGARALPRGVPVEGGWRERTREALSYIRRHTLLARLLAAQAVAFLFFFAVIPVEVVYAKKTLHAGSSGYGWLLTAWGAGMLAGGLVFARAQRGRIQLVLSAGTLAIGAAYLGLAAAPSFGVACAVSIVGGVGNGIQWISVVSAVQELTSGSMQARVLGVLEAIGAALPAIGFLMGGAIATLGTPRTAYLVAGLGVFATLAVAAVALTGFTWPTGGTVAAEESAPAGGHGPAPS
jgi:MFS family permease